MKSILLSMISLFLLSSSLFLVGQERKEDEQREENEVFIVLNSTNYHTELKNKEDIKVIEKDVVEQSAEKPKSTVKKESDAVKSKGNGQAKEETKSNTTQEENIVQTNEQNDGQTMYVTATAYTAHCDGCTGITYTGINLKDNPNQKVIAVDPNVIPLGSKVWVEGYGTAIAADIGGAIKGNRIDVFIPNEADAKRFGMQQLRIKIVE